MSKYSGSRKGTKRLTLKQLKFIQRYLETKNATQAAMEVYRCKNLRVAAVLGSENLTKPDIACEIDKYRKKGGLSIQKAINAIDDAYEAERKGASGLSCREMGAETGSGLIGRIEKAECRCAVLVLLVPDTVRASQCELCIGDARWRITALLASFFLKEFSHD